MNLHPAAPGNLGRQLLQGDIRVVVLGGQGGLLLRQIVLIVRDLVAEIKILIVKAGEFHGECARSRIAVVVQGVGERCRETLGQAVTLEEADDAGEIAAEDVRQSCGVKSERAVIVGRDAEVIQI
jgi:hypothetical protein